MKMLNGKVLIRPEEPKEVTENGLAIPERAKMRPQTGFVVETADETVCAGDRVFYEKLAGVGVKVNGDAFVILDARAIYAVVGRDDTIIVG